MSCKICEQTMFIGKCPHNTIPSSLDQFKNDLKEFTPKEFWLVNDQGTALVYEYPVQKYDFHVVEHSAVERYEKYLKLFEESIRLLFKDREDKLIDELFQCKKQLLICKDQRNDIIKDIAEEIYGNFESQEAKDFYNAQVERKDSLLKK